MAGPNHAEWRSHVGSVVASVLRACDAESATRRALEAERRSGPVGLVISVGKAAPAMARATVGLLPAGRARTIVVAPEGTPGAVPDGAECVTGEHPLPGPGSLAAARLVMDAIRETPPDAHVLLLLSGGASALLAMPAEGLALRDLREVTRALLRAGAPIDELNVVRRHVEQLKGGRLALLAAPRPVMALALSDVPADRPDLIGSGPVTADPSTPADALAVLERRAVAGVVPQVRAHLERSSGPGLTPKPGDPRLGRATLRVVAGNDTAVAAACDAIGRLGFGTVSSATGVAGEARRVGGALAGEATTVRARPRAVVLGGETTVTVRGGGRGGRNHELALAGAIGLDGVPGAVLLAFATDGVDGDAGAAGAAVTGATLAAARGAGEDGPRRLLDNDSAGFFDVMGESREVLRVRTGPTGTNVNDVAALLLY